MVRMDPFVYGEAGFGMQAGGGRELANAGQHNARQSMGLCRWMGATDLS